MKSENETKRFHKKEDLFDIFVHKREQSKSGEMVNPTVAFAVFVIQWEAYIGALYDFGVIDEKSRKSALRLPYDFH